jgi:AAA family ATP:ADP antiporter
MEAMIHDKDQKVTTSAFRYLLKHYSKNTEELFNKYLYSDDKTIANAALIGLSLELRNNQSLQNRFSLENKIKTALIQYTELSSQDEKNNKIIAILEAIGNAKVESYYDILKTQLKSDNIQIVNVAILSAAKTLNMQFIDTIIAYLSRKETRKNGIEALMIYGEPIIEIIAEKIKSEDIDLENATYAILVIENFASQKAVNTLIQLTSGTEHTVKIEAIEALRRLKWKHNHLQIKDRFIVDKILDECHLYQNTLAVIHSQIVIQYKTKDNVPKSKAVDEARKGLISLLELRLDRQLQRIFRFLGIKYPPNDVDSILNTILKGKEEQRIHAIEFLENILDSQLKKELIPVAESILIGIRSEESLKKLNLKVLSEIECYNELLKRKDVKLKLAVLYLIEKSDNPKFNPLLELILITDNDQKIKKKISDILKSTSTS